jgi:hypothetical protein
MRSTEIASEAFLPTGGFSSFHNIPCFKAENFALSGSLSTSRLQVRVAIGEAVFLARSILRKSEQSSNSIAAVRVPTGTPLLQYRTFAGQLTHLRPRRRAGSPGRHSFWSHCHFISTPQRASAGIGPPMVLTAA